MTAAVTVLAISTSSPAAATALADESGLLGSVELRAGRRHAELLHVAVDQLAAAAGVGLHELTGVAVDVGPGLFTGIRVGVAAAKGYAMALGLPVVAMTSLDVLRRACESAGQPAWRVVPVVDLRRSEVAWSLPSTWAGGDPSPPRHGPPGALVAELVARPTTHATGEPPLLLAGDGALRYDDLLTEALTSALPGGVAIAGGELAVPPVASLALEGVRRLAAGEGLDPLEVRPLYLREADVRINWTTRHDAPGRTVGAA